VGSHAQAAPESDGVVRHADVFAQETTVHDRDEFPVDLGDKDIFVLNTIPIVGQKLTLETRGDDVVIVTLYVKQRFDMLQNVGDFIPGHLTDDHLLPAREHHILGRKRRNGVIDRTQDFFKVNSHGT
jgi:hypothetical protein